MSDSFMVAARIPMSREGFEAWLSTPAAVPGPIVNPDGMFDGWFWSGRRADTEWDSVALGVTPREFFAEQTDASCRGESPTGVLVHRDGALEAYVFHLGYQEESIHTALLMLAAAGAHKSGPEEDTVLFWAETSARLWPADATGWLAVLSVGRERARFVGTRDLTAVVAGLRPAEGLFFDLVARMAEDEENRDSGRPFRTDAPRDPAFTDPAVLDRPGGR
ncbi:hypothetical protein ACIQ9E_05595 [Streptomyces sp. NPDC094448]|uniref:hypothetical protein n=1 Tax=Streptomyces sp. NPDC094448 TaxID=3366063 RepID=UPI003820916C